MRVRYRAAAEYEPIRYFPSASGIKTVSVGKIPPGWKDGVLLFGGRPCAGHFGPGDGSCNGITVPRLFLSISGGMKNEKNF